MLKAPKILYFLEGPVPKANEEVVAYAKYGPSVYFRNGALADSDATVEPCDGVAGTVPQAYAHFPAADNVIQTYRKEAEKAATLITEPVAPVAPVAIIPPIPPVAPVPPAPPAVDVTGWESADAPKV